jgi:hypothetical protein
MLLFDGIWQKISFKVLPFCSLGVTMRIVSKAHKVYGNELAKQDVYYPKGDTT